jgi:hypothetical protein
VSLTSEQRELLGDVLAVVLDHADDPLAEWRVHGATPPWEAITFHDDGSLVLKALPRRRYRLIGDDVQVDDQSDPRGHVPQRFRYADGQPVLASSVEARMDEWG